jgi:phage terminase Nu1 subunit (DNA packaging protein)
MPQLVSYEDLARVMDVQPKSIAGLVAKGMPHEARGQYDVGRCFAWYVRYLHAQMNRSGITEEERNSGVNLRVERHRLLKTQADLGELELLERRGKSIPISVYEQLLVSWAITIRQRVLALPSRLSGMLVGLDRRAIQDIIERECRDMLMILSKEGNGDRNSTSGTTDSAVGVGPKDKRLLRSSALPADKPVGR